MFVSCPSGVGGSTRSLATVLAHRDATLTAALVAPAGRSFAKLVDDHHLADIHLPFMANSVRALQPLLRAWASARLVAWAWRHRKHITAIHANGLKELSVVAPVAFLTRLPVVVWVHNFKLPPSMRILGGLWRHLLRKRTVRWAAVSPLAGDIARQTGLVGDAGVALIPNPIDPADVLSTRREISAGSLTVGYLGSAERYKGFHLLADMVDSLEDLPLRWLLFTNPALDRNQEAWQRLRALSLEGRVSVPGKLQDVRQAYAQCDIVVCPSLLESFCRVAAEAMMNGIPVVGSDLDPIRQLLGDDEAGLLFPPGDARSAAAAIRVLACDAGLRHRLGDAGRRRVSAFTPERVVGDLTALYGLGPSRAGGTAGQRPLAATALANDSHRRLPSSGPRNAGI
ncbi:MAG: glycosyltransferase family 4 protein [Acidimicrobiales bacterium]